MIGGASAEPDKFASAPGLHCLCACDGDNIDDGEGGKRKVTPLIETKRGIGYMIREPKN